MPTRPITRKPEAKREIQWLRSVPFLVSDWTKNGDRGVPGALLGTFPAREKYLARGCENPQRRWLKKRHSEEISSD